MCIGTPMTLLSVDGLVARAATRAGDERTISLALTGGGEVGTWVLVHLDTAIRPAMPKRYAETRFEDD